MSRRFINVKRVIKKIKNIDDAIVRYIKLGKIPAIPYRAFLNIADYFFIKGNFERAEELLAAATNFASASSDAILNLGTLKQTIGNIDEAFEYYSKAIEKDSKNVKAYCMLGNCYSLKGNIDKAIEEYKKAIDIDSRNSGAYLCWGINLLKQKKYKEALGKFQLASEYNPKDAKPMFMYASVEIELGEYDSALDKLLFIISSTENNFGAYHNIAYIYFKKKEYKKSILYANKAIEIMPVKIESYLLLGDSYSLIEQNEMALNTYQLAEERSLKSKFLYLSWGITLQKLEKDEEAIDKFKKVIELNGEEDETAEEVLSKLAECYYKINDVENAKIYVEKVLKINSQSGIANFILANVCISEDKTDEAINYLNKSIITIQDKSEVYRNLGQCYLKKNDIEKSNSCYDKALEYNTENKLAYIEYIKSLLLQKQFNKVLVNLHLLEKLAKNDYEVLALGLDVHYNIAKEDISAYNKVKAVKIAEMIKTKYPDKFDQNKYRDLISRE